MLFNKISYNKKSLKKKTLFNQKLELIIYISTDFKVEKLIFN